jgi:hypothetical protein
VAGEWTPRPRPFTATAAGDGEGGGQYVPGVLSPVLSPRVGDRRHLAASDAGGSRMLRSARRCRRFPEWRTWELSFVSHAEMRMEQRGVTEVDVRAMAERSEVD